MIVDWPNQGLRKGRRAPSAPGVGWCMWWGYGVRYVVGVWGGGMVWVYGVGMRERGGAPDVGVWGGCAGGWGRLRRPCQLSLRLHFTVFAGLPTAR